MSDRHSDDIMREIEPIDRERLVSTWSHSEAKQALFQEITTMPAEAPVPARPDLTEHRAARSGLTTRRLAVVAVVATMAIGTVTAAVASLVTPDPFVPETLSEAVEGAFAAEDCVAPDDGVELARRSADEAGGADWTVATRDPQAKCVRPQLDAVTQTIHLAAAPDVATRNVLESLPALSLETCHTTDELAALVTQELTAATGSPVDIRSATRANISVPEEGPAQLLDHADSGCAVVAGVGGASDGAHIVWIAPSR